MNFNLYSVQEMEHKKVLGIKDYHNNTDQESQQAHSAKHRKLLSELWKQKKIKLEAIDKTNTMKPLFRGHPQGTPQNVCYRKFIISNIKIKNLGYLA